MKINHKVMPSIANHQTKKNRPRKKKKRDTAKIKKGPPKGETLEEKKPEPQKKNSKGKKGRHFFKKTTQGKA